MMKINKLMESFPNTEMSEEDKNELDGLLKKLSTELSEAVYKIDEINDYKSAWEILTFLSKDAKSTANYLKDIISR